MQILDLLAGNRQGLTLTELAHALDVSKPTVSRILSTLEEDSLVDRDPRTHCFRISWRLVGLALRYIDGLDFHSAVKPMLEDLAAESGELVHLAIVERDRLIYVSRVYGKTPFKIASLLGHAAPLHATASGKVWLSSLPEEKALQLVLNEGLTSFTDRTVTDLDRLRQSWAWVREHGYAVARGEWRENVWAIAVPVHTDGDGVIAVVIIAFPGFASNESRIPEFVAAAKRTAEKVKGPLKAVLFGGGDYELSEGVNQ